jgi:peptide/nickel transport system substrate-binding protein
MKRSLLLVVLTIVVIGGLLITSCGKEATTTPATTAPVTTKPPITTAPVTQAPAPATTMAPTQAPAVTKVVPTGTLRIASDDFSYESFDPVFWTTFWGWATYDTLVSNDVKGNVAPCIAESYSLSADGLTWTFKIRKGVKFHNGDPLTANDVKFSVDRFIIKESTNPWSPYVRTPYESTSVPDDYTFIFKTKKPEPFVIVPLQNVHILPKNYIEKVGIDAFRKAPIGSGPYKFVKLVSRTSCELEANMDYWGQLPYFKTVIDYMVPEEATRVALLKTGDVDIAQRISPDRMVQLRDQGFSLKEVGLATLGNLSFPGTWETESPTKDIRIRQALSYAINRQEMCDTYYKGLAQPGSRWQMQINVGWGWDPSWQPDPYDVTKAKALLAEAGYPDKFKDPVIRLYGQQYHFDMVQMVMGYWNKLGVQTKYTPVDAIKFAGLFFASARAPGGDNIGAVIPWLWPGAFNAVYHSANMYISTGVHATGNDPKADELYQKCVTELDPVKAKQYYTDFQNYGYSMWVNIGIMQMPSYAVFGPNVGKVTPDVGRGIYAMLSTMEHAK